MATIYTTESVLSMEEAAEVDSDGYNPVRSPMVRSTKAMVSRREKRNLKIVRDTDLLNVTRCILNRSIRYREDTALAIIAQDAELDRASLFDIRIKLITVSFRYFP